MSKIFLSGGGDDKQSFKLDALFVRELVKRSILYLPMAQTEDAPNYPNCLEWITDNLGHHNIKSNEITMWTDLSEHTKEEFESFGAIYIGGGMTGQLNRLLKESSFPSILPSVFQSNLSIYGGSAGAIVFGQSLNCIPEEMDPEYPDSTALQVLPRYSIRCHYDPSDSTTKQVIQSALNQGLEAALCIPETSGLTYDGKELVVVGDPVTTFTLNKVRKFCEGETIPLINLQ